MTENESVFISPYDSHLGIASNDPFLNADYQVELIFFNPDSPGDDFDIFNEGLYKLSDLSDLPSGGEIESQFVRNVFREDIDLANATKGDIVGTRYTVTASAKPGYAYAGYTLTRPGTGEVIEERAWADCSRTYENGLPVFEVTIAEDAELTYHFQEMDTGSLFDNPSIHRYISSRELTAGDFGSVDKIRPKQAEV